MSHIIEKDWTTDAGYRAVVIMTNLGHRCGYVGITDEHFLHNHSYMDHHEKLTNPKEQEVGRRGPITVMCWDGERCSPDIVFDVHGSLTYSGGANKYPVEHDDLWWFGYDCAHIYDNPDKCNLEFCMLECESLARQLKAVM